MCRLISVLVRSCNDEPFIGRTLKAIFEQECSVPFEVVCCDDASVDRTPEIIASFPRVVRLPRPEGEYRPGQRLNYMIRHSRGDIIVFNTENLESEVVFSGRPAEKIPLAEAGGYYYIKRVAALPGDTVKLADDQLWVRPAGASEFRRIQELEPRFAKVYSGKGGYQGHCKLDRETPTTEKPAYRALDFAYGQGEYRVPDAHYLMLGDNSRFSLDSRYFGAVPRRNMIGRAWFVFYPFSRRMGAVDRNEPLDMPTGTSGTATFPVMSKQ